MAESEKQKIAILGGGVGAMVAAFELTDPAQKDKYDVTVYQMGWRLGGKGASGRNMDASYSCRIEEHGLHVWSGFYDNAFRLMRKCYRELGRAPNAPLARWQDAFKPKNSIVLEEFYNGRWFHWPFRPPTNDQLPGEPDASLYPSLWSHVEDAIQLMWDLFNKSPVPQSAPKQDVPLEDWLLRLVKKLTSDIETSIPNSVAGLLHTAAQISRRLAEDSESLGSILEADIEKLTELFGKKSEYHFAQEIILKILALSMDWYRDEVEDSLDYGETRRYWIFLNFVYGHVHGVIEDNIIERGFGVVDDQDYSSWLQNYIMDDDGLTMKSPLARFLYDAVFAFIGGDPDKPELSAGVALNILIRMAFTWRGAVIWEMQAGMGDTVFTPFYKVLKARGVKFKFFHRVRNLHLSEDRKSISAITIGEQVQLKRNDQEYQPLVMVKGLACWPSTPLYDQIVDGDRYKREGIDFESWCTGDIAERTLKVGEDFDKVVLGISLGALPYICCELIKVNENWKHMVERVKTVRTHALQLWLKPTADELGWTLINRPILDTYDVTALNTWADMTHLLDRECWPAESNLSPKNIAYFCGPMKDEVPLQETECGPTQDCEALSQKEENKKTREVALHFLNNDIGHLWPNAVSESEPKDFQWNLLIDNRPGNHDGEERLDSQYIRANVQPPERYVLSVSGSTRYRLDPGQSGFDNLYLAGDWTKNALNSGCVEPATISGMLASNAISGYPKLDRIVGLTFGQSSDNADD